MPEPSTAPTVLVLTGATATGKTGLAMGLADRLRARLISADSAMVYRGMDIGTAKPTQTELERYPHDLVDIRDPTEPYSVADFVRDADAAVRSALAARALPVLVGGTMMYLKAFRDGLDEIPTTTPAVRAAVAERARALGWAALHAELAERDPVAAASIHPSNTQRLARAHEVYALTGQAISSFWGQASGAERRLGVRLVQVWLDPFDRAALHARIAQRCEQMWQAGFVAEVAALRDRPALHLDLPALRAVGYRQVWRYLDGEYDERQAQHAVRVATRQLARRQFTWLRGWSDQARIDTEDQRAALDSVARLAISQHQPHSD